MFNSEIVSFFASEYPDRFDFVLDSKIGLDTTFYYNSKNKFEFLRIDYSGAAKTKVTLTLGFSFANDTEIGRFTLFDFSVTPSVEINPYNSIGFVVKNGINERIKNAIRTRLVPEVLRVISIYSKEYTERVVEKHDSNNGLISILNEIDIDEDRKKYITEKALQKDCDCVTISFFSNKNEKLNQYFANGSIKKTGNTFEVQMSYLTSEQVIKLLHLIKRS